MSTNLAIETLEKMEGAYYTQKISGDDNIGTIECVINNPSFKDNEGVFIRGDYCFLTIFHEYRNIYGSHVDDDCNSELMNPDVKNVYKIEYVKR